MQKKCWRFFLPHPRLQRPRRARQTHASQLETLKVIFARLNEQPPLQRRSSSLFWKLEALSADPAGPAREFAILQALHSHVLLTSRHWQAASDVAFDAGPSRMCPNCWLTIWHDRLCVPSGSGPRAARTPAFKRVNIALGNIKAAITGTYRAINSKHVPRYLAEFEYRFNRRYDLAAMIPHFTWAAVRTTPMPYRLLKLAGFMRNQKNTLLVLI
jgi:hypothetical protein